MKQLVIIELFLATLLWLPVTAMSATDPDTAPDSGYSDEEDEEDMFAVYGDDDFLSIATGSRQPISKAPAVASIITSDDIQDMGAPTIEEVLQTVPGLHVAQSGAFNRPLYLFRGIYSPYNPQVLMLVNGIPVTNLFHGDRGLGWVNMPTKVISRIEIIRGPGSAIYGADAFAGVINVITKQPNEAETQYGVRAGDFGTISSWYESQFNFNETKMGLNLEVGKTDGHKEVIIQDAQSFLDSVFGTNASNAPGAPNGAYDSLELRFHASADAWQFRQPDLVIRKPSAVLVRHDPGALQKVASAGVVAESRPLRHDVCFGSGGEVRNGRPAVKEAFEARRHGGDGGLLQHDLAEPDPVGLGSLAGLRAPGQVASITVVPIK